MNPIFTTDKLLRSDSGVESPEDQNRRKEFQRRLTAPKHSPGSSQTAKHQLDAFLRHSQQADPSPGKPWARSAAQQTTLPVPASVRQGACSDDKAAEDFDAHAAKNSRESLSNRQTMADPNDLRSLKGSEEAATAEKASEVVHRSEQSGQAAASELERLRNALDRDISTFSTDDLVSYLEELRSDISARNLTQRQSDPVDIVSAVQQQAYEESLASLDFMHGYADAQSRPPHERQQIDQAFSALREQIIVSYAAVAIPTSAPMQSQIATFASMNKTMTSSDKKSASLVGVARGKDALKDAQDDEVDLMMSGSERLAKQAVVENSDAASRSRQRRKEKEKEETTLPLIIQQSA